jgi:beta-lactam-binding protein with PASTA domain
MSLGSFVKSPEFRKIALRAVLLYGGLIAVSWFYLRWYTDHGEYVSVPDMKGMTLQDAITAIEDRDLTYLVIDSIYDRKAVPGTVVDQSPVAESQVKEGRQVFLTIYRISPPMEKLGIKQGDYAAVAMIKLKNKSIDFDTLYEDNNTFPGSIIRVTARGKSLKADDVIARGSKITLVIGRTARSKVIVPDLQGMTCLEAQARLDTLNLVCNCRFEPGLEYPTAQDSATFRVCRQDPQHDPLIGTTPGRTVDLWLYNTPCAADTSGE